MTYRHHPHLVWEEPDEDEPLVVYAMNAMAGKVLEFRESAALIFLVAEADDPVAELSEVTGLPAERIRADVERTLDAMERAKLLYRA